MEETEMTDERVQEIQAQLSELRSQEDALEAELTELERCQTEKDETCDAFQAILAQGVSDGFQQLALVIASKHKEYNDIVEQISTIEETVEAAGYTVEDMSRDDIRALFDAEPNYSEAEQQSIDAVTRRLKRKREAEAKAKAALPKPAVEEPVQLGRLQRKNRKAHVETVEALYSDDDGAEDEEIAASRIRFFSDKEAVNVKDEEDDALVQRFTENPFSNMLLSLTEKQLAPLKTHQREALQKTLERYQTSDGKTVGFLLAHYMGLGKTLTALTVAQAFHNFDPRCRTLLLGPKNVLLNWRKELIKWEQIDIPHNVLESTIGAHGVLQVWNHTGGILITSYEIFRLLGTAGTKLPDYDLAILDEAHLMRNTETSISKEVQTIASPFRLALTGTPFNNNIRDYMNTIEVVQPNFLSTIGITMDSFEIRQLHSILKGQTKDATNEECVMMQQHIHVLRLQLNEIMHNAPMSILKKCLPEIAQTVIHYEIQPESMQKYLALGNDIMIEQTQLRSILMEEKMELTSNLIQSVLDSGRHPLVFSYSKPFLLQMHKKFPSSFLINGDVDVRDRQDRVDRFQDGEGDVFFISTQSGCLGLTLVRATVVILVEPGWNPTIDNQAWSRAWRQGQENPVQIYRLVAKDTIEAYMYRLQVSKYAMLCRVTTEKDVQPIFDKDELTKNAETTSITFMDSTTISDPILQRFLTKANPKMLFSNHETLFEEEVKLTLKEEVHAQHYVNADLNKKSRYLKAVGGGYKIVGPDKTTLDRVNNEKQELVPPFIPLIDYTENESAVLVLGPHKHPTKYQVEYKIVGDDKWITKTVKADHTGTTRIPIKMQGKRPGNYIYQARAIWEGKEFHPESQWSEESAPTSFNP